MQAWQTVSSDELKSVRAIISDVDGVLTNGGLYMDSSGNIFRQYSIYDGMGISRLVQSPIQMAIITGGKEKSIEKRFSSLGIREIHTEIEDKYEVLSHLAHKWKINFENMLYVGDDINDLTCMKVVGLAVTVPNAMPAIKNVARYCTEKKGGQGAIREVIDSLLGLNV